MTPAQDSIPAAGLRDSGVAVIIPTLDQDELLEKCLDSLARQSLPPSRVLVVDNSPRSTPPAFLARFPQIEWMLLARNRGTAGAFNRGLAKCPSVRYVLFLNDDAELESDCLVQLVTALEREPDCSIAVPKLVQTSTSGLLDGVGDEILLGGGAFRVGHGERDAGQYESPERVLSACGAAALVRRSVFDDVGTFDEDFFAYREDVDFCLRAQWRRHACLYVPAACGRHLGSATLGSTFHPRIIRLSTRNQIFIVLKNYSWPMLFRLAPHLFVFQLLWAGLALRKGAFFAYVLGMWEALRFVPRMCVRRRAILRSRRLSNGEMLARLRESERRIWRWQSSPHNPRPSQLLRAYFRIFGRPNVGAQA